jgi:hypothetical protein
MCSGVTSPLGSHLYINGLIREDINDSVDGKEKRKEARDINVLQLTEFNGMLGAPLQFLPVTMRLL